VTELLKKKPNRSHHAVTTRGQPSLLLSLFPGIDLLGRGFEAEGFCVVRGPDLIWGQNVIDFHAAAGYFEGIIAGSPCQGFSSANRMRNQAYSEAMVKEFIRVIGEAQPEWFLLENVPTVPTIDVDGYRMQRLDLHARECGLRQSRLRHFQFGSRAGDVLCPKRDAPGCRKAQGCHRERCCLAVEGSKMNRRNFADFCELQGLPRDFDLPGWSTSFKYRAVGNGVPIPMARVIARAVIARKENRGRRLCICGCGRPLIGNQKSATVACRKRLERQRRGLSILSVSD
jgi:DNA (cytosine-5)-methyltransferase 1